MFKYTINENRLERWFGKENFLRMQESMDNWYGPSIPVLNSFGSLKIGRGAKFIGWSPCGEFSSLADYTYEALKKYLKRISRNTHTCNTGFASLSALIAAATGGKSQMLQATKAGTAGTVGRSNSLWTVGASPPIGAAGGATGTGAALTRNTTGALKQINSSGSDTMHITTMTVQSSVAGQMLLMYDRLWDMSHTMTVDPRSCDAANPPTRYQTTATAPGNFLSGEVTTALPAATPTIAFDYINQAGSNITGAALSTITSGAAANTVPYTSPNWYYPLSAGDTGLRSLQNSANAADLSAAMASGVVTWFIGHPLAFVPMGLANAPIVMDGINSAFNLVEILPDACISFLELAKGATTATNWWINIMVVSG